MVCPISETKFSLVSDLKTYFILFTTVIYSIVIHYLYINKRVYRLTITL